VCKHAKNGEQVFKILILKLLAIFYTFGQSLEQQQQSYLGQ